MSGAGTEILLDALLVLAALSLLEALLSLKGGIDFRRFVLRAAARPASAAAPPATLIVPCRGLDPGFSRNLQAFFELDYPELQLLLVTGDRQDPCYSALLDLKRRYPGRCCRILLAGPARGRSQKVHNLLHALGALRQEDSIIAFGDSDIRPAKAWLRHLAAPLEDPSAGMSTGFRWYVPQRGNAASVLRAVWNAGSVSLLKEKDSPFAWGGAMAIRRELFEQCRIAEVWKAALSDDYAISQALRSQGKAIFFQPRCLSFSYEDCSWSELFQWTFRQLAITRVYHPRLWALALAAQSLNAAGLWGSCAFLLAAAATASAAPGWQILAALVTVTYGLGCCKGWLRLNALRRLYPHLGRGHRTALITAGPLAAWVTLAGLYRSIFSREILWRGIRYRMVSPRETLVLDAAGHPRGDKEARGGSIQPEA